VIPFKPVVHSPGFYPITIAYLGAVTVLVLTVEDFFSLALGIVLMAVMAVGFIVAAAWRDIKAVHVLVNGQKHELMTELADLKKILRDAGIQVPASQAEKRQQTPKDENK
jgi:hypothetical protein